MAIFARMWAVLLAALLLVAVQSASAQKVSKNPTDTITSGGDNTRSGYQDNHNLDPNVVKSGSFNMIWRKKLLGNWNGFTEQIYAQPLVYTPDGGDGNQYVYVISQMNIAYILDSITGDIIAHRQLKIPYLVTPDLEGCNDIADCVGSTATGVIDPDTGTWYVTTKTYEDQARTDAQGLKAGRYFIHALDTLTLESRPNFPIPLEGILADNAPWRMFEGGKHHQRPALMQVGEHVYAGFASHCVQWNFTGWVIGWHATEGRLVTKYAMEGGHEVNGIGGGIWMSGGGLASDNAGRMFFATGNGYASQLADDPVPGRQPPTSLEEAVVNMAINEDGSLTPTDFFMPWEKRDLDGMDKDLGTSGFVLLQPSVFSTETVRRIGTVAGKTGKLYFLNLDDLGGYQMGPNRKDKALQVIEMAGPVFASAGTWPHDGGYVYVTPVGHQTVAYKFGKNGNGDPVFSQAGVTTEFAAGRQGVGHATVTSMNGQPGSGILWISDVDGSNLRAYGTIPEDGILPTLALFNNVGQMKFSRPTFGDGKVFLTSHTGFVTAFGSPVNMPLNCSSPYDAGTVNVGETSTTTITCKAKIPLTITSLDLDVATNFKPYDYVVPRTMAVGDTFTLKCNFTPQAVGPLSTNINIRTTNGGTEVFADNTPVGIRGTARSQTPILAVQPDVLSFGELVLGSDSAGKNLQFTLINNGESPLVITGYKVSLESSSGPFLPDSPRTAGPFTFVDLPAPNSSIPGRGSISTTVNFNATTDGYFAAYLVISSNGGTKNVGAFGTAGGAAKAKLEWQLADGTWVEYKAGVTFDFGPVPLGTQQFRTMRLTNLGGTTLTTTISKPPVSGALAAVNALGAIAEGSQISPGKYEEAQLICSPPKSQVNENATTLKAVWTMNNNDATFGKHEIDFTCNGASTQVGPLDPSGQAYYRYLGCYKDGNPNRNLEELIYYSVNNTNGMCQTDCSTSHQLYAFAATQYEGECWCGSKLPTEKVSDSFCQYLCKGNFQEYCGGDGAYMSLFADRRILDPANPPVSSSSSTPITSVPTISPTSGFPNATITTPTITSSTTSPTPDPTSRPNFEYLGCANEGTTGRALAKDATASATLTHESCQDYCTSKGFPLSGMEYSTECYCGNTLENGSKIGGSNSCDMPCGGNPDQICGGPGALSIYNNTALVPPRSPAVVPNVGEYVSQGCYTEGIDEKALAGATTGSVGNMTVQICVSFCRSLGARFAGIEYSTECYCGTTIAATAAKAPESECNMLCGGDPYAYCGGPGKLNVYAAPRSNSTGTTSIISSTTSSVPTDIPTITSSTPIPTPTTRPGYTYLGCANEGDNGRALSKDSLAGSTMTLEHCQDYCTSKNLPLSGVEYGSECYCGNVLENGSTIGGSTACTMPCAGNPDAICGGPSALSVYNNTALVPPRTPAVVPNVNEYVSQGCYTEGIGEKALAGATTGSVANMTVATCVTFCKSLGARFAGIEYSTECYCGTTIASTAAKAPESECNMLCGGDPYAYCGGPGKLNVYAAPQSNSTGTTSIISSTTSSVPTDIPTVTSSTPIPTPTTRPGYTYLGCANEGTDGHALSKDSLAESNMTLTHCQDYCTSKGHPLSGVEYGIECYCGDTLEHGSRIGGSTACDMPCGGDPTTVCGGPSALSVYNNTLISPPRQPAIVPSVGTYLSQGCYTEGVDEKALAGSTTGAVANMTVASCVSFCSGGGFRFAGLEYATECYCGSTIATTAKKAPDAECSMHCGGDPFAFCGGPSRLNLYAAPPSNSTSSSTSAPSTAAASTTSAFRVSITSSSATPSSTIVSPWKYLGCANETENRSLSGTSTSGNMTLENCQNFCFENDFPLAGAEFGDQCYCGTALQNGATLNQTGCDMECTGDSSKICGGVSRLSVYNYTLFLPTIVVPSVGTYLSLGCYTEGNNTRALEGHTFVNSTLTAEQCVTTCEDRDYMFAGMEFGSECYCGSSLSRGSRKAEEKDCNMGCGGNKRTYCGAANRLNVYQKSNVTSTQD